MLERTASQQEMQVCRRALSNFLQKIRFQGLRFVFDKKLLQNCTFKTQAGFGSFAIRNSFKMKVYIQESVLSSFGMSDLGSEAQNGSFAIRNSVKMIGLSL